MCYIDNDIDYEDSEWDDELDVYEDDEDADLFPDGFFPTWEDLY